MLMRNHRPQKSPVRSRASLSDSPKKEETKMFGKNHYSPSEGGLVDVSDADVKSAAEYQACVENDLMLLLAKANEPTPWAFDGFIVKGDQVMIAGAPKAGKTWLALQLALAAASGGQFLRWKAAEPLKTLYINMEVGEHMWAKRVALQVGGVENALPYADRFYSMNDVRSIDVLDPEARRGLAERIRRGGYEFIVIDVLSRCHYADENDNGHMKQVLLALRVLCGDATHVVVHHSRKPPLGAEHANLGAASIRGASSIVGEVDMAMTLVVRSGQGARYSLQVAARNVQEPEEMLLDRSEDMKYYEHEGGDNSIETVIAAIFRSTGAVPTRELHKAVADGLGISESHAKRHVRQAVAQGLIEAQKIGRNVQYIVPGHAPFLRVAGGADYAAISNGDDCPF